MFSRFLNLSLSLIAFLSFSTSAYAHKGTLPEFTGSIDKVNRLIGTYNSSMSEAAKQKLIADVRRGLLDITGDKKQEGVTHPSQITNEQIEDALKKGEKIQMVDLKQKLLDTAAICTGIMISTVVFSTFGVPSCQNQNAIKKPTAPVAGPATSGGGQGSTGSR